MESSKASKARKPRTRTARRRSPGKYRAALLELRDQLATQVKNLSSVSLTSTKQAGEELADVGSDNFIRETELALMTEEERRLALIEAALERLEDGTYGICLDCAADIPDGRLAAKPYAVLCIDCKMLREKNGDASPQWPEPPEENITTAREAAPEGQRPTRSGRQPSGNRG